MDYTDYEKLAKDFAAKTGTRLTILSQDYKVNENWGDNTPRCVFKCRLSRNGQRYTFDFWQSIIDGGKRPTMYEVLACLQKYDVGTFWEFCNEFGYDIDSRRAECVYREVCREYKAVQRLFGDVMDFLQDIN